MDHEAFVTRAKNAVRAKSEGRPEDAAAEIRTLLQDLALAAKGSVSEWHQQQALGLLVDALDAADSEEQCRAAWERLIQFTQNQLAYWQKAVASAREDYARWNQKRASGGGTS